LDEFTIDIAWDDEARTWSATSTDIPELALKCDLFDLLIHRLYFAVPELRNLNGETSEGIILNYAMSRQEMITKEELGRYFPKKPEEEMI
jgi:hypothetical protein